MGAAESRERYEMAAAPQIDSRSKPAQIVLLPNRASIGGGAYTRTVRQITIWDGRTVGIARHRGAEWVVQYMPNPDHWIALPSISQRDVYGSR